MGSTLRIHSNLTQPTQLRRNISTFGSQILVYLGCEGQLKRKGRESDRVMSKVHRIAGLKISRIASAEVADPLADFWTPKDALPDLEPAEDRLRRLKRQIFASDTITLTHSSAIEDVFDPRLREEHNNIVARATVYVLNMIVIVMALPVGLMLLFFNILGGENLRTTAHVIALTGMGLALAQTEAGARILGII